jgi:2-methylcitrate dehydratase PrpD
MSGSRLVVPCSGAGSGMNGGEAVVRLAQYAAETDFAALPAEPVRHAKRILLDTLGTIMGGSVEKEATALANRVGRRDRGLCTLIGHPLKANSLNAVLANGTAACWLDFDSGHRPPPGHPLLPAAHPPIHLVPSALAVAEMENASGKELLTALVVGYDTGSRIGMGSRVRAEIHCHGTHLNTAAAAAASRLMKAGRDQMVSAIGMAIHLSMMPSFENAFQGGTIRNGYSALGSALGVLAAQMAVDGFTPERDPLGSIYGTVISPWLDPERVVAELGERFEITLGFIKPYPMCRFGHPAIEAAEGLVHRYPVDPERIDSVVVHTFSWAAALDERFPKSDLAAKFSVPWAVASMLVRKSAGAEDFREAALNDARIGSISAKVTMKNDPAYTAMTPGKRPARVVVKLIDGQEFEYEVLGSGGGPDAPLSEEKFLAKFHSLADPVVGCRQAEAIVSVTSHLEDVRDIHVLTRLCMPAGFSGA